MRFSGVCINKYENGQDINKISYIQWFEELHKVLIYTNSIGIALKYRV